MTYRFKLKEPIAEGVRRIGLEQIDIAAARLAARQDVPSAIHDARRCLKRLRALLRLVRPGLPGGVYKREAAQLADIGRLLSGARDLDVMLATLDKLAARQGGTNNAAALQLRKLVTARRRQSAGGDDRRKALQCLEHVRKLFKGRAIQGVGLEHLGDGLEATLRKARKTFHKACDRDSDEAFHAWRKTVQQHWRHMALLSRCWPEALSARAAEAKELSRLLGEDHDYAVLVAFARAQPEAALDVGDLAKLIELCRSCQAELRAEARLRGERLLAERADDLKDRVTLYWSSARRLADLRPSKGAPPNGQGGSKGRTRQLQPEPAQARARRRSRPRRAPARAAG
jgi:hypothetical protein